MNRHIKVLIVDDSADDAELVVMELRRGGFQPEHLRVDTPDSFTKALAGGAWDALIVDYRMPHFSAPAAMDIYEACGLDIPFIIVSAAIGEDLAVMAMKDGAHDYIMKDNLRRLPAAIERELREAEIRAARKSAEDALVDSETKLRLFAQFAPSAIAMLDTDLRYVAVSDKWLEESKLTGQNIIGKYHFDLFPQLTEQYLPILKKCLGGVVETHDEDRIVDSNGSIRWIKWEVRPWHKIGGEIGGVIIAMEDITERKNLQAQFVQAQKMEAVGLLAGGVAHDFRNQLTIIKGYCELLLRDEKLGPDAREGLLQMLQAATRSTTITEQLLAFSRQQVLEPQVVQIDSLIKDLSKSFGTTVREDIRLNVITDSGGLNVRVDQAQFHQALINMVLNARDAMPAGGQLTIETSSAELDEEYARHHVGASAGPHVLITVSDTGVGMDSETQKHIFEPFFTTKPIGQGTGLGLSMVYGFVKQSGGHITVYSEPGNGTTFRIYLPCVVEPSVEARPSKYPPSLVRGSGTVLVVEDEAEIRKLVSRTLDECGYEVIEAGNSQEAISKAAAAEEKLDLLITDVIMMGMNGPQLAEQIRSTMPDIRVLYISGHSGKALTQHGLIEQGATLLPKPFSPRELTEIVAKILTEVQGRVG